MVDDARLTAQGRKLASRVATEELQEVFAALSGDRNPMHMDRIAARRTQAGQRVVHGVHTLLWAMETLVAARRVVSMLRRIKVKFLKWIYLGDVGELWIPDDAIETQSLTVVVAGLPVLSAQLSFDDTGGAQPDTEASAKLAPSPRQPRLIARNLTFGDLLNLAGDAFTPTPDEVLRIFPHLSAAIGATAVAEMTACSYVVGMEAPGLHSTFSKLDLTLAVRTPTDSPHKALHYAVASHDERFRKAQIKITGQSIRGFLDVFIRVPPVDQATMEAAATKVIHGEFLGMEALIVGGSRGLGEVTAKLIAAGGGRLTITYAQGKSEAESVCEQIRRWGGNADTLIYDARRAPDDQLTDLPHTPTHVFYFATNTIYKPKKGVYSATTLAEFSQFYLQGFYDLCTWLTEVKSRRFPAGANLIAFYPSTIFLEDRPPGMTEYAMVKAAGEQMCRDMNITIPGLRIIVSRLPRLSTDQTAGVMPEHSPDPVDVLLPIVREMHEAAKI